MRAHELARILLDCENLPVATHADNHTHMSGLKPSQYESVRVGVLSTYGGDHVVIGNFSRKDINKPNWYVTEMIYGRVIE